MMNKVLFILAGAFIIIAVIFLLQQPASAPEVAELEPDTALTQIDEADTELDSLDAELEKLDSDASGL